MGTMKCVSINSKLMAKHSNYADETDNYICFDNANVHCIGFVVWPFDSCSPSKSSSEIIFRFQRISDLRVNFRKLKPAGIKSKFNTCDFQNLSICWFFLSSFQNSIDPNNFFGCRKLRRDYAIKLWKHHC